MPKQPTKYESVMEKLQIYKLLEQRNEEKNTGHSASTQTWVDTRLPNNFGHTKELEKLQSPKKEKRNDQKDMAFCMHSNMTRQEMLKVQKKLQTSSKIWEKY